MEDFFTWIGTQLGAAIRFIVEGLSGFFTHFDDALKGFFSGLAGELGIGTSLFSLLGLILGLYLLYKGVTALLRGSIVGGILLVFLGLTFLGWLIS
ncbi:MULTISPECIES: hypothetical protein [Cobetia]|uniref:Uncharacterized protein n=1 Tax=Cobetia crustatorum TaxID=553385 RepID=A0A558HNQ6_9GAMM|nr:MULTISPECIES: hypothetical protein [Cobetia]TVU70698.1 hypothetical protein FQP86_08790 [Cobetia crustatorum]